MFPLSINSRPSTLMHLAPAAMLIAIMLAILLATDRLFDTAFRSGLLLQYHFMPLPFALMIGLKLFVQITILLVPLLLITPIIMIGFYVNTHLIWQFLLIVVLVTPSLCFIAGITSALTLNSQQQSLLLALLTLPFYLPILIFAANGLSLLIHGDSIEKVYALLTAFLLLSTTLGPIAITGAINIMLQE